jgi:mono/diheme cytochrome c family protein
VKLAVGLVIAVLGIDPAIAADGDAVFRARCARCHGDSGRTDTASGRALKVRPLASDAKLARMTPADILKAIKSNPKHRAVGALVDVDDRELGAAAAVVRELAKRK